MASSKLERCSFLHVLYNAHLIVQSSPLVRTFGAANFFSPWLAPCNLRALKVLYLITRLGRARFKHPLHGSIFVMSA